jgi:hypothetical protein
MIWNSAFAVCATLFTHFCMIYTGYFESTFGRHSVYITASLADGVFLLYTAFEFDKDLFSDRTAIVLLVNVAKL